MPKRENELKIERGSEQEERLAGKIEALLYPEESNRISQNICTESEVIRYVENTKKFLDAVRLAAQATLEAEEREVRKQVKVAFLKAMRKSQRTPRSAPEVTSGGSNIFESVQKALSFKSPGLSPVSDSVADRRKKTPVLIQRSGMGTGRTFSLIGSAVRIGSDPNAEVHIPEPEPEEVSRYHAELTCTPHGYAIKDLGSNSGTQLNGKPLTPDTQYQLVSKDRIRIADVEFEFDESSQSNS